MSKFRRNHVAAWVLLIVAALLCSACVTQKACYRKFPPTVLSTDSIIERTTITYRDTVIHDTVPGEVVKVLIPSGQSGTKSKGHVHLNYKSTPNGTEVECIADSLIRQLNLKNKEINTLKQRKTTITITTERKVYLMPWWGWLIIIVMGIMLIGCLKKILF